VIGDDDFNSSLKPLLFKWCTMTIDLDFVLMCDDMIEGGSEVEKSNNKKNPIVQDIINFFTSHSTLQI
jgi:hypothetical protein